MSFSVNWRASNVVITFLDILSFDEMYEAKKTIYGDSRYAEMKYQIIDLTNVHKIQLTKQDIHVLSTLEKSSAVWNNNLKLAIITLDKKYIEMIATYFKIMKNTNWSFKVFDTIDAAHEWLK